MPQEDDDGAPAMEAAESMSGGAARKRRISRRENTEEKYDDDEDGPRYTEEELKEYEAYREDMNKVPSANRRALECEIGADSNTVQNEAFVGNRKPKTSRNSVAMAVNEGVDALCSSLVMRCVSLGKDALRNVLKVLDEALSEEAVPPCKDLEASVAEVEELLQAATEVARSQPSLLYVSGAVCVVGDIHGQFVDLIRIFERCGYPPATNYIFLGDYVDRGKNGIECCILLIAYKVLYPESIFLLRGNHECAAINRVYGFFNEVKDRYSVAVWQQFCAMFDCFPIAAIVQDRIFCIHGGLSPHLNEIDDIAAIERPVEVPDKGMLCDFLWSDPDHDVEGWAQSDRGVSYTYGADIIEEFLEKNDFDMIVRGHQVVEDGYEFFAGRQLVTLFSAPNYCNEFDNAGAVMCVGDDLTVSFEVLKPLTLPGGEAFHYAGRPRTPGVD